MTIESVSLKMGVLTALGSAVLQSSAPTGLPMSAVIVPIVSAVVGGLMSYAVLKTTVQKMEKDVRDMRDDMRELYTLVRDSMTKIAHMEGRLDSTNH